MSFLDPFVVKFNSTNLKDSYCATLWIVQKSPLLGSIPPIILPKKDFFFASLRLCDNFFIMRTLQAKELV